VAGDRHNRGGVAPVDLELPAQRAVRIAVGGDRPEASAAVEAPFFARGNAAIASRRPGWSRFATLRAGGPSSPAVEAT
jgi:hypothetical protein